MHCFAAIGTESEMKKMAEEFEDQMREKDCKTNSDSEKKGMHNKWVVRLTSCLAVLMQTIYDGPSLHAGYGFDSVIYCFNFKYVFQFTFILCNFLKENFAGRYLKAVFN